MNALQPVGVGSYVDAKGNPAFGLTYRKQATHHVHGACENVGQFHESNMTVATSTAADMGLLGKRTSKAAPQNTVVRVQHIFAP